MTKTPIRQLTADHLGSAATDLDVTRMRRRLGIRYSFLEDIPQEIWEGHVQDMLRIDRQPRSELSAAFLAREYGIKPLVGHCDPRYPNFSGPQGVGIDSPLYQCLTCGTMRRLARGTVLRRVRELLTEEGI